MESLHRFFIHPQEALGRPFLGHLILKVPHSVFVCELLLCHTTLGQNTALKATHVEEQVGIVLAVDRHKAVLPLNGGH